MSKDKLITKNKTVIELEAGADLYALQVKSPDRQSILGVWEQLTEENLSEIQIQNGEGMTVGRWEDMRLEYPIKVYENPDGSVISMFCLHKKTDEEKRLDAVEKTIEVHEEALMDVAEVTSVLAEQMEKGGQ